MEYRELVVCLVLLGSWGRGAQGRVIGGPGHHSLTSWRFDNDAVRQRCLQSSVTNVTCAHVSEDRLLVHPDDCQLFYYCVGDVAICRQCPAQLHFSPTRHVCDRPQDAGCESQSTTIEDLTSPLTSTPAASSTTSITSPPTISVNDSSTYPTTLPSSPSISSSSTITPSVSTTPALNESTTKNSMTTYIKLQ